MEQKRQRGSSLVEVLVATAIVGLLSGMSVVAAQSIWSRYALAAAAYDMRVAIAETRFLAMQTDRGAAIRFRLEGGEWTYAIHLDGDGDGISSADIDKGIDRMQGQPRAVRTG